MTQQEKINKFFELYPNAKPCFKDNMSTQVVHHCAAGLAKTAKIEERDFVRVSSASSSCNVNKDKCIEGVCNCEKQTWYGLKKETSGGQVELTKIQAVISGATIDFPIEEELYPENEVVLSNVTGLSSAGFNLAESSVAVTENAPNDVDIIVNLVLGDPLLNVSSIKLFYVSSVVGSIVHLLDKQA